MDELGLDRLDKAVLNALVRRFGGGPVGVSTLAVAVGEEIETVQEVAEPFLVRAGLLARTPRGRVATPAAWQHLGLRPPAGLDVPSRRHFSTNSDVGLTRPCPTRCPSPPGQSGRSAGSHLVGICAVTQIFPLLLLAALLVAMMMFSRRNKQRMAAADSLRRERITTGTDVMTTSGLYGTVVSVNADGTVLLSVAPGVEVRWTIAALREVGELPEQYREPIAGTGGETSRAGRAAGARRRRTEPG